MFDFVNFIVIQASHIYMFCTTFIIIYIGSSFICIILLTKQLQILMKTLRLNFL